jgi:hypothetical protein
LTNVAILVATIGAFDFFLRQLHRWHVEHAAQHGAEHSSGYATADAGTFRLATDEPLLLVVGYLIFIWASTWLIRVDGTTPDLLFSAFVYLVCGLLVRLRRGARTSTCALLGLVMGLGYYVKAPMFLLAFVFTAIAWVLLRGKHQPLMRTLAIVAVFAAIAAPLVVSLSRASGHLTFGESARWNYARGVNNILVPVHWQGWPAGSGTPLHPTRQIWRAPAVYEFGTPVPGAYPPWLDPAYWYAGVTPHFDLQGQIRVFLTNMHTVVHIPFGLDPGLVFGTLLLLFMSRGPRMMVRAMLAHWFLIVPCITGIAMFTLVYLETRYIGAYVTILYVVIVSSIVLADNPVVRRLVVGVTLLVILFWISSLRSEEFTKGRSAAGATLTVLGALGGGKPDSTHVEFNVARALQQAGLRRGDRVGYVGESYDFYWARLAGVRVSAEIRQFEIETHTRYGAMAADWARAHYRRPELRHVDRFWAAPLETHAAIARLFAACGVRALVTDALPTDTLAADTPPTDGSTRSRTLIEQWVRVLDTRWYFLMLPDSPSSTCSS